jgi:hypothetical protein
VLQTTRERGVFKLEKRGSGNTLLPHCLAADAALLLTMPPPPTLLLPPLPPMGQQSSLWQANLRQ